ncbi:hypothetical protein HPB48_017727 [Haemaphysalis longicornis]|uniref:PA domain-containing protein n=1 Tax=Haemaphysalis longicornis TaxID=44386 RepID=A0A9J6G338_HAELO|nr:hypothetical protein HPB48_017727 [Haemaphysalis longicornis]
MKPAGQLAVNQRSLGINSLGRQEVAAVELCALLCPPGPSDAGRSIRAEGVMFPHRRMPCHITILYVYSIVSLTALFHATLVAAEIVVIPHSNSTPGLKHIFDQELSFSAMIPDEGVPGLLTVASPLAACQPIAPPPFPSNDSFAWFVLIARFECGLADKARYAQQAGYDVAVIYDRRAHNNGPFDTRITPEPKYYPVKANGLKDTDDLNIYAVIVSEESGIRLKRYTYQDDFEVKLYPESFQSIFSYLLPFLAIVGIAVFGLAGFVDSLGSPQVWHRPTGTAASMNRKPCPLWEEADRALLRMRLVSHLKGGKGHMQLQRQLCVLSPSILVDVQLQ